MKDDRALLVCINHNLKRTARATAQAFDRALRPYGLRSGQFDALTVLRQSESLTLKEMCELLGLDRTTLLRNLEPLEERGLILKNKQGRHVILRLSPEGRTLFRKAFPAWRNTHESILDHFGRDRWKTMKEGCRELERIAAAETEDSMRDS